VIDGDHIRIDEADPSVSHLNLRKDKPVDQDGEALAAGHGGHNVRSLPGLGENLDSFGMVGAVHIADVVGPSSRGCKKTCPQ
jgi:hypothetical protein